MQTNSQNDSGHSIYIHELAGPLVYPPDDSVLRFLREGWFEYREQTAVSRLIRPGDCFVDVGAHCGLYTALAQSRMNGKGQIIAVEPIPALRPFIQQNASGPTKVQFVEAAVSVTAGEAILHFEDDAHSAYATLTGDGKKAITVATRTIESLVPQKVRDGFIFIKLDIEGVECLVIEQAADFLRSMPNIHLMIEFDENNLAASGQTTADLADLVRRSGFSLFDIDNETGALIPFGRNEPLWGENLIATRRPEILADRLSKVPDSVSSKTQAFFERGRAAHTLFLQSEEKRKMMLSILRLQPNISSIIKALSGDDRQANSAKENLSKASTSSQLAISVIEDEIGKIRGMAEANARTIADLRQDAIDLNAKASRRWFKRAVHAIGL